MRDAFRLALQLQLIASVNIHLLVHPATATLQSSCQYSQPSSVSHPVSKQENEFWTEVSGCSANFAERRGSNNL